MATAILTWVWVPVVPSPSKQPQRLAKALDPRRLWSSSVLTFRRHRTFRYAVIAQFFFMLGTYPAQRFLLILLKDRFGAEDAVQRAAVGLVAAIVCAAVAAGAAGAISDRVGRRPVLYAAIIFGTVGMVGVGVASNPMLVGVAGIVLAVGVGAFQAVNWALLSDDIPTGEGAPAGLFGPLVDLADRVLPGATYELTFGLAALIVLSSVVPLRRIDLTGQDDKRADAARGVNAGRRVGRRGSPVHSV